MTTKSAAFVLLMSFFVLLSTACSSGSSDYTADSAKSASTSDLLNAKAFIIKRAHAMMESFAASGVQPNSSEAKELEAKWNNLQSQMKIVQAEIDRRGGILFQKSMKLSGLKEPPCGNPFCNYFGDQARIAGDLLAKGYWEKTDGGQSPNDSPEAQALLAEFKKVGHVK